MLRKMLHRKSLPNDGKLVMAVGMESKRLLPQEKILPLVFRDSPELNHSNIPQLRDSEMYNFNNVTELELAAAIFNGKYILIFQSKAYKTAYRLVIYSCNGDLNSRNFNLSIVSETTIDHKLIIRSMMANYNHSLILFGYTDENKLSIFHYEIVLESNGDITVSMVSKCVVPGYDFTILGSRVLACKSQHNLIGFAVMLPTRHPSPLFLFIYSIEPSLTLCRMIDLNAHFPGLQGYVTDVCFHNNNVLVVTNSQQVFCVNCWDGKIDCKDELQLPTRPVFMEINQEHVYLQKLTSDIVLALSAKSCVMYYMTVLNPDDEPCRYSVTLKINMNSKIGFDNSEVSSFHVCPYSRTAFIFLSDEATLYSFDPKNQTISLKLYLHNDCLMENGSAKFAFVNWYGNEIYLLGNVLFAISNPEYDISLKNLCRLKILGNYSESQIWNSGLPNKICYYVFNEI